MEMDQTDSGIFDNCLEILTITGRPLPEAVSMMMPTAWENDASIEGDMRSYFKYQASVMEPWDGPALVSFTDGDGVGASLDRNGLRPCRYYVTRDNKLIVSSEAGVIQGIKPEDVIKKGRLSPGKMLWADFKQNRIMEDKELKEGFARAQPWGQWLSAGMTMKGLMDAGGFNTTKIDPANKGQAMRAFGYQQESLELLLLPMATSGEEALGSMGNDAPLAVLSKHPRFIFDYFYQLFAQVTNPPIDPIRESVVMDLGCWVGPEGNLLSKPQQSHCERLWLDQPCLSPTELAALSNASKAKGWRLQTVDTTFPKGSGPTGLEQHISRICQEVVRAVDAGCQIVVLSDRAISAEKVYSIV